MIVYNITMSLFGKKASTISNNAPVGLTSDSLQNKVSDRMSSNLRKERIKNWIFIGIGALIVVAGIILLIVFCFVDFGAEGAIN